MYGPGIFNDVVRHSQGLLITIGHNLLLERVQRRLLNGPLPMFSLVNCPAELVLTVQVRIPKYISGQLAVTCKKELR